MSRESGQQFGPVCTCGHTSGWHYWGHGECGHGVKCDPKTLEEISRPCSCQAFKRAFPISNLCEYCDIDHPRARNG